MTDIVTSIDELEEPEDRALRTDLGLRPSYYPDRSSHPDTRPCPSWCWVGQSDGEYDHEIDVHHPMTAEHSMSGAPRIVASQYAGEAVRREGWTQTATIELHLRQRGQGEPLIEVYLRQWLGQKQHFEEVLRLSVTDAEELSRALAHYAQVANKG